MKKKTMDDNKLTEALDNLWVYEKGDDLAFNGDVSKELKKLKSKHDVKSMKQGYRGTGKKRAHRQIFIRFENGQGIDVVLRHGYVRCGGVMRAGLAELTYAGQTPAEVAEKIMNTIAHIGKE